MEAVFFWLSFHFKKISRFHIPDKNKEVTLSNKAYHIIYKHPEASGLLPKEKNG